MDFSLSEEQNHLLSSIDVLMKRHLPPAKLRQFDERHETPAFILPLLGEAGLLGIPFPARFGGLDLGSLYAALVVERLALHAGAAAQLYSLAVDFGGMSLLKYGSREQQDRLLPRLIRGELQFSLGLTEPGAGTDVGAIITSARKGAGGWVINGRKTWISNADEADYIVTACRTEKGSQGSTGLSVFLVPRSAKGIHMTRLDKVGNKTLTSWDIAFDDVEVAGDALMGAEGHGFRHLMTTLQYSRIGHAANSLGQAQAAVNEASSHARSRIQFGKPISTLQAVRHKLAEMQTRVDQARLTLYHGAWRLSQGLPCRKETAQAKLVCSEALQFVTRHGMQIMASAGYAADSAMQRLWRDSGLYTFGEGTNEIQSEIIAREMGL